MSYIPRRRLVLASTRSAGVHTQWPTSQMPWDAEEVACADEEELCTSSEMPCFTQETALSTNSQADWGLQPDHPASQHMTSRAADQANDSLYKLSCYDDPVQANACSGHVSNLQQQLSQAVIDQFTLPREEYSDIYNFLTKGTGQVQGVSAKERALFKLTDLRQVDNLYWCLLLNTNMNGAVPLQVMRVHGVTQAGRTKQVRCSYPLHISSFI